MSYGYHKPFVIDHSKVGSGGVSDFPVLVALVDAAFATVANGGRVTSASGFDIILTSDAAGTTQLDHEIESYDPATGTIAFWVRVPTLSDSVDTTIYVQYGDATVTTSQEHATSVWDADFDAVLHCADDAASTTVKESTSNARTGTFSRNTSLVSTTAGGVGRGFGLNGSSDHFHFPRGSGMAYGTGPFTIEAYLKDDTVAAGGATFHRLISWYDGSLSYQLGLGSNDAHLRSAYFLLSNVTTGTKPMVTTGTAVGSGLHLIQMRSDGAGGYTIWVDGVASSGAFQNDNIGIFVGNTTTVYVGQEGANNNYVNGVADEVRISKIARSDAWIQTTANAQLNPSTFATLGGEVVNTSGVTITGTAGESEAGSGSLGERIAMTGTAGEGESATGFTGTPPSAVTGTAGEGESASGTGTIAESATVVAGEGEAAHGTTTMRWGAWQAIQTIYDATAGYAFKYQVWKPNSYSPDTPVPLVIHWHGQGDEGSWGAANPGVSTPADDAKRIKYIDDGIAAQGEDFPALVIAIQTPVADESHGAIFEGNAGWQRASMLAITQVQAAYSVIAECIIAVGLSFGSQMLYDVTWNHPGVFAAQIPVSDALDYFHFGVSDLASALPIVMASSAFVHIPTQEFHGALDTVINVSTARSIHAAAIAAGATAWTYTEYPTGDHQTTIAMAYADPALWAWAWEQRLLVATGAAGEGQSAAGELGESVDATAIAGEGERAAGDVAEQIRASGSGSESEVGSGDLAEKVDVTGAAGEAESAHGFTGNPPETIDGTAGEAQGASGEFGEAIDATGSAGAGASTTGELGESIDVRGSGAEAEHAAGDAKESIDISGSTGEAESAAGTLGEREPGAVIALRGVITARAAYSGAITVQP